MAQKPQKSQNGQQIARPDQNQGTTRPVKTKAEKMEKKLQLVNEGAMVFKLDLVQTVIATQMFKSNDYMFDKLHKSTGLGAKSVKVTGDQLQVLDYKRYKVLLELHKLNKELAKITESTYNAPSNFHESLSMKQVEEFLEKNTQKQLEKKSVIVSAVQAENTAAPAAIAV